MLYQLPNGKVIHLTVEQYLDLTDLDIQHLIALDAVIFNHKTTYSNIIIINAPYLFYVQFLRALNI